MKSNLLWKNNQAVNDQFFFNSIIDCNTFFSSHIVMNIHSMLGLSSKQSFCCDLSHDARLLNYV